jgi:hypothetical protein
VLLRHYALGGRKFLRGCGGPLASDKDFNDLGEVMLTECLRGLEWNMERTPSLITALLSTLNWVK